jgi:uncharacterized membrane protein
LDNDLAHDPMVTKNQILIRSLILGILALGYALLAHLSTVQGGHGTLGALLAIGPVGLIALVLAWRSVQRVLGLGAWLLAAVSIAAYWDELKAQFVWAYLIQQVSIYSLLGLSFGRSLALDRVPLCTQMALREYGTLPADAIRYTRQVTLAWTIFFAVTTATLLLLFFAAPLGVWSAFANFGAAMLVILMFAIENRVRLCILPNMTHGGLISTIRAVGGFGVVGHRS